MTLNISLRPDQLLKVYISLCNNSNPTITKPNIALVQYIIFDKYNSYYRTVQAAHGFDDQLAAALYKHFLR